MTTDDEIQVVDFSWAGVDKQGLAVIAVFYVFIAFIGLWASYKSRTGQGKHGDMLANRDIGFLVGLFTMTATWVCGGYINGTAEEVYKDSKGNNIHSVLSLPCNCFLFTKKIKFFK